jgi:hypothetical protein
MNIIAPASKVSRSPRLQSDDDGGRLTFTNGRLHRR